jgi:hypothetical protein
MTQARLALGAILLATASVAIGQAKLDPELVKEAAAQRERYAAMPDTPGSGPYPAIKEIAPTLPDHVIYRPSDLSGFGGKRKLGVLAWGNGGCSADGASARLHLAEIASHGYIAIAPGGIYSGPGGRPSPGPAVTPGVIPPVATKSAALIAAIDWALVENKRAGSPLFGKIDPAKIAVAGHSCGGLQAIEAAHDPRVRAVIINNSGTFADGTNPIRGIDVPKSSLQALHAPMLYILGGPKDVAYPNGMDDFAKIESVPVVVANLPVGHLGTFAQPNGGIVASVSVDWLNWQLNGDAVAAKRFTGPKCGLCVDAKWSVQRKKIS